MASETRKSDFGLMQALLDKPHKFSFFQLLHLLQRYTGGARLGSKGPASEETVRVRPDVSLSFPAADVQSVEVQESPGSAAQRYRVTTSFMGLYSSDSPLPTFYAEDFFWREDNQEAVRDFMDIFHHRALSLLYRAWEKYRHRIQFRHEGSDEISRRVYSLVGLGTEPLIRSTGLPSVRLLRYAGLVTQKPHCAAALSGILRDYFALGRVAIDQCVERWIPIDPSQQNRLGMRNCSLGRDLSIGERVRDCGGKFRVAMGPLGLRDFQRLFPDSPDYSAMINLIRYFAADRLDFDIKVLLRAQEIPPLCLSSTAPQRLGWTSCLPHPRQDAAVLYRQPKTQSPQTISQRPEPSMQRPERQENRG
jgi:type VI secretion system protein ImpH